LRIAITREVKIGVRAVRPPWFVLSRAFVTPNDGCAAPAAGARFGATARTPAMAEEIPRTAR